MGLSTDLISQFVKNTNDSEKKKEEIVVYGTIVSDGERNYVQIDGSSELTPINTTVETNVGDRVLVTVKNHTATVTGNASDPAVGTKRAGNIESSIKQTADSISIAVKNEVDKLSASLDVTVDGIRTEVTNKISGLESSISKIEQTANGISSTVEAHYDELTTFKGTVNGELSGVKSSISKIEQTAKSITTRVESVESTNKSFSEFKQTVEGFSFMGKNGTVKINGGDIVLTGCITFGDLTSDVSGAINKAGSDASSALGTATTANSTANSALSTANNANDTANSALGLVNTVSSDAATAKYNAELALSKAQSASQAAAIAQQLASNVQLPSYLTTTHIGQTTIMSPTIVGGMFYAAGQDSWTTMDSKGLHVYTDYVSKPKIELINEADLGYVSFVLGVGTDATGQRGRFYINKGSTATYITYYSGTQYNTYGQLVFDNGGGITAMKCINGVNQQPVVII